MTSAKLTTPFADTSLYRLPEALNENVLVFYPMYCQLPMKKLACTTAMSNLASIAIIGMGPIGTGCLLTS